MSENSFTQLPFDFSIVVISISSIFYLSALFVFTKNYLNLRSRSTLQKRIYQKHVIRLFPIIVLIILPVTYIIHSLQKNPDVLLIILKSLNILYWLGNLILITLEFKRDGSIHNNMKKLWIFNFLLQTANVVLYIIIEEYYLADLQNFMIYSCCEEAFYLIFLCSIFLKKQVKDLNEQFLSNEEKEFDNKAETSVFTDKKKSIIVQTQDNTLTQPERENFLRFTDSNRRKSEVSKNSVNPHTSVYENRSSFSSDRIPTTPNNTNSSKGYSSVMDVDTILEIGVTAFSRVFRGKKKTVVVYQIEFVNANKRNVIFRSYSEFLSLYKQMKNNYSNIIFPVFPPKRPHDFDQDLIMKERIEAFDFILKFFLKEKLINSITVAFLSPNHDNQTKLNRIINNHDNMIEDSQLLYPAGKIVSSNKLIENETIITFTNTTNEKPNLDVKKLIYNSSEKSHAEQSQVKPSLPHYRATSHKLYPNKDIRNTVIKNYSQTATPRISLHQDNAGSNLFDQNNLAFDLERNKSDIKESSVFEKPFFDIEITDCQIINKKVFYFLKIRMNGEVINEVFRNYDEFKILHEKLKADGKANNESIEDLPNKGNLGIFASENQVVEFRKFALQVYLKYLLNHPKYRNHESLIVFIGAL